MSLLASAVGGGWIITGRVQQLVGRWHNPDHTALMRFTHAFPQLQPLPNVFDHC